MMYYKPTRRDFMRGTVASGAAAGLAMWKNTAASAARVVGANERINLGLIGCGGRGRWIMQNMVKPANANTALVVIGDIWKLRQETYPAEAAEQYGLKPKMYTDYRRLLEDPDVDAVIIATPAHQHCRQTIDAVQAGKHVYVEKPIAPIASDLPELNECNDVVTASTLTVQHGSQGVSCPAARAVKDFIATGTLGKLFRTESIESLPVPYWIHYEGPETEDATNWAAFLHNRESRPFDAHQHASWMGYHDFSSGAIGGWMSHFINTFHFVAGCGFPKAATAFGGRFALTNDPRCDAPDQVTVVLEYDEGFHTQFVSHFGSAIGSESTLFMFEKGALRTRFGHDLGNPTFSSEGVDESIEPTKLLDFDPPYPGQAHVTNWFDCIRNSERPNADMEFGYKQGIAVLLGDLAYTSGRRVVFDQEKREIHPA
jgi:predicted dehydrogenase